MGCQGRSPALVEKEESLDSVFPSGFRTEKLARRPGARVAEDVGVGRADDAPAARPAAEQIALAHLNAGDAVLPGQHAGPFQHLQRLSHRAAGAVGLGGDRFVGRKAAPAPAVVEAP
jgi:hypothetical protein